MIIAKFMCIHLHQNAEKKCNLSVQQKRRLHDPERF